MRNSKKTSKTKFAILGMLTIEPMSGYQIKQTMLTSTSYFWAESDGQLYPYLSKLLEENAVTCEIETSEGGRQRKIYHITERGKEVLQDWLLEDENKFHIRNEFMLKLFFGANRPVAANIAQIEEMIRKARRYASLIEGISKRIAKEEAGSPHLPYWLLTIEQGKVVEEAKIKWGEEAIKTLKQLEKGK